MKIRKWTALLCLLPLLLTGCSQDTAVYVQNVGALVRMGGIAPGDRFAGLVVSDNVTEIKKDKDKSVAAVYVKAGDAVKQGQELFDYDTEELQLNLDKQRLEVEQFYSTIQNLDHQISILQQAIETVSGSTKLQYAVEIQSNMVDLKEAQIKVKMKEADVAKSEELLDNATVTSPVEGRVQSVNDNGETDRDGNPLPYITIQQTGSYRIKGMLGELQRGGLQEGDRILIRSRLDENKTWNGVVKTVDYENPVQSNDTDRYYGVASDEMSSSSKYAFYVEPENVDGLLLGEHVYMELYREETQPQGLSINSAFLCYNEDGSAFVWAESRGKLEKRSVELGAFHDMTGTQEILNGLTEEDHIAFPDPELCREGVPVTRDQPVQENREGGEG